MGLAKIFWGIFAPKKFPKCSKSLVVESFFLINLITEWFQNSSLTGLHCIWGIVKALQKGLNITILNTLLVRVRVKQNRLSLPSRKTADSIVPKIFKSCLGESNAPNKKPTKTKDPKLLQYICCAVFQSNSLSKSARLSGIKISKVKIWGELFKRTLFCAPAHGTFVSKCFWTGKIVGRGLSFMTFNRPVRHSACVPSTYKPPPLKQIYPFYTFPFPLQLSHLLISAPASTLLK